MITATILGNITRDCEQRSAGGTNVVSFTIASNERSGKDKTTTFVKASIWGARGDKLAAYLVKGKSVVCSGSLSQRQSTAKDGTTKTSLALRVDNIEFASSKSDAPSKPAAPQRGDAFDGDDSDIPF